MDLKGKKIFKRGGNAIGIDLGSRNVKLLVVENGMVERSAVLETAHFYRHFIQKTEFGFKLNLSGLKLDPNFPIVATGYGRNMVGMESAKILPELKALVLGAILLTGLEDFVLLDMGGQDSKVLRVKEGRLIDFQTNDKCAASSGRYLENMASVLGVTIDELGSHYENPAMLNSTCATFGESEVIAKLSEGFDVPSLCSGVNHALFRRIKPLLSKQNGGRLIFTGGVAYSHAIKRVIEIETDFSVTVPESPEFVVAVGCCASLLT